MDDTSGSTTKRYARVPLDVAKVRELRLAKGWSQHELSVRVGVQGAPAVSAWERGTSVPHPKTLRRLAEVLGVDPGELLDRQTDRSPLTFAELRVASGMSRRASRGGSNRDTRDVRS